jgi:hypothetical protein
MKLPREVWVGETVWTIRRVRKVPDNPENTIGLADPSDQVIYVKSGQGFRQTLATLIHELIHACEFTYEYDIPHKLIDKLDEHLADILIDNFL